MRSLSAVVFATDVNTVRIRIDPPGVVCWSERTTSLMAAAESEPAPLG